MFTLCQWTQLVKQWRLKNSLVVEIFRVTRVEKDSQGSPKVEITCLNFTRSLHVR